MLLLLLLLLNISWVAVASVGHAGDPADNGTGGAGRGRGCRAHSHRPYVGYNIGCGGSSYSCGDRYMMLVLLCCFADDVAFCCRCLRRAQLLLCICGMVLGSVLVPM